MVTELEKNYIIKEVFGHPKDLYLEEKVVYTRQENTSVPNYSHTKDLHTND